MVFLLHHNANPIVVPAPCAGRRPPRPSAHLYVSAALDPKKKGFGEISSKSPKPKVPKDRGQIKRGDEQKEQQGAPSERRKAILLHEDSRELQSVIKSVEKDYSKKHNRRLNIDPEVAAKGKVDFVKIDSWGEDGKDQNELGNLKVKAFSPAFSSRDKSGPFYERLVHRLQLLESKGDISVVNAHSLPQFQHWAFGEKRYLQYLVDQHAVFDALRTGIANIQHSRANGASLDEATSSTKAASAVGIFDDSLGLERSKALEADIKALSRAMSLSEDSTIELPTPTTQTVAYVKYLKQLAGVVGDNEQVQKGHLHLLAHIFAIYVAHLTTGMRIGAKALDCVSILKQAKGVSFYRDYSQHVADPLKVFITAINKVTDFVSTAEDQELIMEELPKAIQKTSLLLVPLAVTEQAGSNDLYSTAAVV